MNPNTSKMNRLIQMNWKEEILGHAEEKDTSNAEDQQ